MKSMMPASCRHFANNNYTVMIVHGSGSHDANQSGWLHPFRALYYHFSSWIAVYKQQMYTDMILVLFFHTKLKSVINLQFQQEVWQLYHYMQGTGEMGTVVPKGSLAVISLQGAAVTHSKNALHCQLRYRKSCMIPTTGAVRAGIVLCIRWIIMKSPPPCKSTVYSIYAVKIYQWHHAWQ